MYSHVSRAARGEIGNGLLEDAEAGAAGGSSKQGCGVHGGNLTKSALHGGCHADSVLFDDAGARLLCARTMSVRVQWCAGVVFVRSVPCASCPSSLSCVSILYLNRWRTTMR